MSASEIGGNRKPFFQRLLNCFRSKQKTVDIPGTGNRPQLDEKVAHSLEAWSKNQGTGEKTLNLLKAELERYEFELALRRMKQKADETRNFRSTTDCKLPYELQPISENWETALSRLEMLQKQPVVESPQSKVTESPTSQPSEVVPSESKSAAMPSPSAGKVSTSSTTSSVSTGDLDAEKPAEKRSEVSSEDLARWSKTNMAKFEKAILENTKLSLLSSKPTVAELEKWDNADRRRRPQMDRYPKLYFSKKNVEFREFCRSCRPRH